MTTTTATHKTKKNDQKKLQGESFSFFCSEKMFLTNRTAFPPLEPAPRIRKSIDQFESLVPLCFFQQTRGPRPKTRASKMQRQKKRGGMRERRTTRLGREKNESKKNPIVSPRFFLRKEIFSISRRRVDCREAAERVVGEERAGFLKGDDVRRKKEKCGLSFFSTSSSLSSKSQLLLRFFFFFHVARLLLRPQPRPLFYLKIKNKTSQPPPPPPTSNRKKKRTQKKSWLTAAVPRSASAAPRS